MFCPGGARVVITGRRPDVLAHAAAELGKRATALTGDVSRLEELSVLWNRPGPERTPMGGFGTPEDVGWAAVYLCSQADRGRLCLSQGKPRGLRRLLSTHCLATTPLPLEDGRVLHIRKPSLPDPEQAHIYKLLGVDWKSAFPPLKTFTKP